MKKSTLNMISSITFLVVIIIVLAIMFINSSSSSNDKEISSYYVPTADIASLETEAKELISGRENNAGVPIAVPKDKMGKSNPFANPK